jgi:NTE family protein
MLRCLAGRSSAPRRAIGRRIEIAMSTIGLALGGGGAKGFAHVGVLRALEQLDIKADLVVGTSMGGIIGAMYAAGLSVDRIETRLRATGLTVLASREKSHLGLLGRDKVVRWLREVVDDVTFEQLARKLAVVAVDLESEAEVILDSGPVVDALLATSAFPGVFAPVRYGGRYLIDGGALNNVPFDVARHLGADKVIACSVSFHRHSLFQNEALLGKPESFVRQLASRGGVANIWAVVERTLTIMQDEHLNRKLAECPPDVLLCPEVGHVGLFDVHQYDACLAAGMAAVYAHEAELIALRDEVVRPPRPPTFWQKLRGFLRMS